MDRELSGAFAAMETRGEALHARGQRERRSRHGTHDCFYGRRTEGGGCFAEQGADREQPLRAEGPGIWMPLRHLHTLRCTCTCTNQQAAARKDRENNGRDDQPGKYTTQELTDTKAAAAT